MEVSCRIWRRPEIHRPGVLLTGLERECDLLFVIIISVPKPMHYYASTTLCRLMLVYAIYPQLNRVRSIVVGSSCGIDSELVC